MFRAAPATRPVTAVRPVVLAAVLMVLLAAATIASVPLAPAPVTLLLAAAALAVRPLVVLHHRRATARV
ncbi:hypothetical protein [Pseudonocardia sp. HH130630-07]|uniref:hypothetical protein n=1 Tax=Pseudonocardia sp. HH130630-07 TaxID=1690815 RepID=UPI000814F8BC|nr:hypothetical protein [Pseudonocardia sp. HH130630-07]ANY08968.1 hypothetical protein AFB00_24900 [Pseudonocardia sp. HH130630-07]